ncbi:hypothetical protein [Vibrio parahaemolyticus]|uniref:hypothetical protein n=1 Tax=Vibrio parahaemolyticus TaxID=670 RepID=UPI00215076ED|nr:hypothetical protein [Vibrio parahaemolyticus]
MPIQETTSARDAQQKLLYHFNEAIETVLQEQSIHYERTNGNSEQKVEFYFHSADYQCPKYQAGMTTQDLCYERCHRLSSTMDRKFMHLSLTAVSH